jgi:hypothetical protein
MQPDEMRTMLKEREITPRYGISIAALRKRRRLGLAPMFLRVGRSVYYRVTDLEAWLDQCTVSPKTGNGNGGEHGEI